MKRFVGDVKKYYNYAVYSAKAELKEEVAGSYLNWIWWILEPVCLMFIYAFIFGFVFKAREENFTAFIYIGLAVWTFFNQNLKNSVTIIKKNKGVISKVYLPKFIMLESKMFVNGFKMLVSFAIVVVLMFYYRVQLTWNIIFFIPLMVCLWLVTFGIMCILCHYGVYVQDLANVVTIVLRLVFYMTGIMFSIDHRIGPDHPELAAILGKANPMAFIIDGCRRCLIYGQRPSLKILALWMLIGLLLSIFGVGLIYKNENSYVKVS
jgi:ABC-type polysaccharide/polyol phosphate export permease